MEPAPVDRVKVSVRVLQSLEAGTFESNKTEDIDFVDCCSESLRKGKGQLYYSLNTKIFISSFFQARKSNLDLFF